jgi:hypothetical protein
VIGNGAILLGVVFYVGAWIFHDDGLNTRVGTWRTPPEILRRLVRRGRGPIHAANLALQVWAVVMVVAGVSANSLDPVSRATILQAAFLGIALVAILWGALAFASSRGRA